MFILPLFHEFIKSVVIDKIFNFLVLVVGSNRKQMSAWRQTLTENVKQSMVNMYLTLKDIQLNNRYNTLIYWALKLFCEKNIKNFISFTIKQR